MILTRLIDADRLKKSATDAAGEEPGLISSYVLRVLANTLDAEPTVDAMPVVHGHWKVVEDSEEWHDYDKVSDGVWVKETYYDGVECSNCGATGGSDMVCCPYCTARMDEPIEFPAANG